MILFIVKFKVSGAYGFEEEGETSDRNNFLLSPATTTQMPFPLPFPNY